MGVTSMNEKMTCGCTGSLNLSQAQQNYLDSGTYEIKSVEGKKLFRRLQIVGMDPGTGNLLILESYTDNYPYKKLFIISPNGNTEKYKGQIFQNVS